jgi:hypothetical protein
VNKKNKKINRNGILTLSLKFCPLRRVICWFESMPVSLGVDSLDAVFAFGAFMLEVACGRRLIGQVILVDWVSECLKRGAILDASDPRLVGNYVVEEMELHGFENRPALLKCNTGQLVGPA